MHCGLVSDAVLPIATSSLDSWRAHYMAKPEDLFSSHRPHNHYYQNHVVVPVIPK